MGWCTKLLMKRMLYSFRLHKLSSRDLDMDKARKLESNNDSRNKFAATGALMNYFFLIQQFVIMGNRKFTRRGPHSYKRC